ncbi:hypothetical protein, partial [Escherichia coli]|uniref:hypothetical protein n=1 Tax=Escherichia coli TaxID=562 RepID=UPI0019D506B1
GRIAQIDNDDLVADAVHLGKAMVGERAHDPRYMANDRRLDQSIGAASRLPSLERMPVPSGSW